MKSALFKHITIFIADEIHSSGIEILKNTGFRVLKKYGLTNEDLLDWIDNHIPSGNVQSVLIVRSVRAIGREDIDKICRYTDITLVCTASSGFDNIDSEYSVKNGLYVMNVPFGNYVSAAEHTLALILSIVKSINSADTDIKNGIFDSSRYTNAELQGKTIGIIGVGRVGSYVARLSRAFRMNILGNDIDSSLIKKYRWIKFVNLDVLLKGSDIITIHTPLDSSTFELINQKKLRLIKKDAILINCARGGIVNEKGLIHLLRKGRLHYAGLDVFINEPEILGEFRDINNIILTPHLAGKTKESKERISTQLALSIVKHFSSLRNRI
jgi:D-3-phosphoglycerate dehydrogenase